VRSAGIRRSSWSKIVTDHSFSQQEFPEWPHFARHQKGQTFDARSLLLPSFPNPDLKNSEEWNFSCKKTANSPEWGIPLCASPHENSSQLLSQFTRIEEKAKHRPPSTGSNDVPPGTL
jgi:hypothetical protein